MNLDLTRGNPMRVLLLFSLPMLAGNLVQQLYNMVDLIIVGRYVGVDALAAVGTTGSTIFFIFSLVAGLTNGASVVISQYYGYGDERKTRRSVATAVYVLGIAGIVLTVFGMLVTEPILHLLKTPPEILGGAVDYLRVIMLGIVATVAYNAAANIIRAMGDSITPLIFLIFAALLNIGLDLLFVITFRMGVAGAAWATIVAQAISAVCCVVYAVCKMPLLRLRRSDFVYDKVILLQTVKLGLPGGIQNSLMAFGGMTIQSVVNTFGTTVVAAYAGAVKLDQMVIQPLLSLAMANATYSAQNMGAGRVDRVRKGFLGGTLMIAIFCAVATPVLYFFGGDLMMLFVDIAETGVFEVGRSYFHVVALFYFLIGELILYENLLRGTGDVMVPVFSNIVEIAVRIGMAYYLSARLGYVGIWWAGPAAWGISIVFCIVRYAGGKWQYKALISHGDTADEPGPGKGKGETEQ